MNTFAYRTDDVPDSIVALLRREASLAGHGEARIAAYVARVELEFGDAAVSRALGMSKARIKTALGAVEEDRENAAFDEWIDTLAAQARSLDA